MVRILVCYYSRTGNTEKMAELVAEGAESEGADVELKKVEDTSVDDLPGFDGIIMGSPTYYGEMAAEMKRLIDESVKHHGGLDGKVGGAFSSSAEIGGGNETTILSIVHAFLIHGMIVQGDPEGDHYGPVSVGEPNEIAREGCIRYGKRVAALTKETFG